MSPNPRAAASMTAPTLSPELRAPCGPKAASLIPAVAQFSRRRDWLRRLQRNKPPPIRNSHDSNFSCAASIPTPLRSIYDDYDNQAGLPNTAKRHPQIKPAAPGIDISAFWPFDVSPHRSSANLLGVAN